MNNFNVDIVKKEKNNEYNQVNLLNPNPNTNPNTNSNLVVNKFNPFLLSNLDYDSTNQISSNPNKTKSKNILYCIRCVNKMLTR